MSLYFCVWDGGGGGGDDAYVCVCVCVCLRTHKQAHVHKLVANILHMCAYILLSLLWQIQLMKPRGVYICDGSQEEADEIIHKLLERGTLTQLTKYKNR